MSEVVAMGVASDVLTRLHADIDALQGLPVELSDNDELLALWRDLETVARRLSSVEHGLIAEATSRRLDFQCGARSMAALARQVVRIDIGEANVRVAAAAAAGPRRALTGESLPPIHPAVAAAQACGAISNRHARIVARTVDQLPDVVQVDDGARIEAILVEQAGIFEPSTLQKIADHQLEVVGVEGAAPEYRERRRDLRLHVRNDGSCSFSGEGTAEFAEHLRIAFDCFAGPKPAADGARDARTPGQRRHDSMIDLVKAAMRAQQLPSTGGVAATLILTATVENWFGGTGTTRTGHGVTIATLEAHRWISGDMRVFAVALDGMCAVAAYGDPHRIFTQNQRLAMIARDSGCAFPGCDAPPTQCEAHHIVEYAKHGPTVITNGVLLCRHHHREFERMGWQATVIGGVPHFIPPRWIDIEQRPIRNRMHHPERDLPE